MQRSLVERLALVHHRGHIHGRHLADAFAVRAHAARIVVGVIAGCGQTRLAQPGKQHAQHLGGVGHRRHGRAQVTAQPLLVNDDGRRNVFQHIGVRLPVMGHELLHEGRIGFVDQPLAFRRNGAEHQRGLARTRHPGKHRDPALGNIQRDVLEIVLPRAANGDRTVVRVRHRLVLFYLHRTLKRKLPRHISPPRLLNFSRLYAASRIDTQPAILRGHKDADGTALRSKRPRCHRKPGKDERGDDVKAISAVTANRSARRGCALSGQRKCRHMPIPSAAENAAPGWQWPQALSKIPGCQRSTSGSPATELRHGGRADIGRSAHLHRSR